MSQIEGVEHPVASSLQSRHSVWSNYHLMVALALAMTAGRIAMVTSREGDTAFLSANDRSRWATVASLVERGTYVIDQQIAIANPIHRNRRPWNSIDKVRHLGADGQQHYYSSKPPLLATVVAGLYWIVYQVTGLSLTQHPLYVPRLLLMLFNLPLLAAFFYATIATIHRIVRNDWSRQIAAASVCFGTMVLPFSISLNNHLPACTATAVAMWIYLRSRPDQANAGEDHNANHNDANQRDNEAASPSKTATFVWTSIAGAAATLGAANELPALSMTALWGCLFFIKDRSSWIPFLAGGLVIAAAFFGTNWIAHQSLRPPYAHRGNGPLLATLESSAATSSTDVAVPDPLLDQRISQTISAKLQDLGEFERLGASTLDALVITKSDEPDRWLVKNGQIQYALTLQDQHWRLYRWDDWYEYPGTYWKDGNRQGVDRGEPSKTTYLMNLTVGHHGLFSITPIWALLPLGWILGLSASNRPLRWFHLAVLLASLVCFLFYLNRPLIDRNYGGVSVCFRWLLWFAPLWLVVIAPAFEQLERWRIGRLAAIALLAMSLFSVSTALQTPWQSPWIYRFWLFLGWIEV